MSFLSELSRFGAKSSCPSIMAIMVGTITVWVTPWVSIRSKTAPGSNNGTNTDNPPLDGIPRMEAIDAAWNMGVWCKKTESS